MKRLMLALLFVAGCGSKAIPTLVPSLPPLDNEALMVTDTTVPTPSLAPTSTEAPPTATPVPEVYTPVFEPADCSFQVPAGAAVECGFVTVPADRDGDPADTIRLAVAVYHSTSETPAPDPVVFLHGGPGGEAIEWIALSYDGFVTPILQERDLLVFDQRGTGLSKPKLDCWEFIILYLRNLEQSLTDEERTALYTDALLMCRDRLLDGGVNLAAYTSAASAADVKDIVTALGYEQVNLYGVSYGTRLAQTVMRDFPAIVRGVVLDSVVPIQVQLYSEIIAAGHDAMNVLFDDCVADPECSGAYPDFEKVFYDLVEHLNTEPIAVEVTNPFDQQTYDVTMDGAGFANAVLWALRSPSYVPFLPQAIYQVRDGDYSVLSLAMTLPMLSFNDLSIGTMISTSCHEHVFATTPEALEAELAAYPSTEAIGLSIIGGGGELLFSLCELWGAAPLDPRDNEPLMSDIPALIIAGEYDPTTPPALGRRVAENLSNSYFFEFRGQGHVPSANTLEDCPLNIALAFLSDPSVTPDGSCVADVEGPRFVLPVRGSPDVELEPFRGDYYGVTGVIPSGWTDVGSGCYNRRLSILDPTQICIQAAAVSTEEWLQWVTERFQHVGLDKVPEFAGGREANGLTWRLYVAEYRGNLVDLALAETDDLTLYVSLVSDGSERSVVYEAVFVPAIDALLPVE